MSALDRQIDDGRRLTVSGVIPVRMESKRLPNKPLRPICGRAMVDWVYQRARRSPLIDRLTVATDSDQILAYCADHEIPAVHTSSRHTSGTNRLIEVMDREVAVEQAADIYVNIQGDEPMVSAAHIALLLRPFSGQSLANQQDKPEAGVQVSTLKVALRPEDAKDPNVVKVVTDSRGRALYFSRAAIPFDRDGSGRALYHKHLGLYAYTIEALRRFQSLPPSHLEQIEQLEQLRFLEDGIPIAVVETTDDTIGVDTEADLKLVEDYFLQAGISEP